MVHYFPFSSCIAIDTKTCAQNLYNHDLQISYDTRKRGCFTPLNVKDTFIRNEHVYTYMVILIPKFVILNAMNHKILILIEENHSTIMKDISKSLLFIFACLNKHFMP